MTIKDLNPKNVDFNQVKSDAQKLAQEAQNYAKEHFRPEAIKDTLTENVEKIVPLALAAYGSVRSFYNNQKNKYEETSSSSSATNALLFVAGAALGATVGILLAPAKGAETRERIAGETNKLIKDVETRGKELVHEVQTIINENVESAKRKYEEQRNRTKEVVEETVAEIKQTNVKKVGSEA